jgi:hypothetical protein
MSKKIILPVFLLTLICLSFFVSAETFTINIKGEPRTPDGEIDLMHGADLATSQGTIETDSTIDNDNGFFEIRNAILDTEVESGQVSPHIQGNCFYHAFRIMRKNNQFEVTDAYGSDQEILITTADTTIDLGILKEDMSNKVMVDFDVPVTFRAEDMSGNVVAENGAFRKFTGMTNSFKSRSTYNLILTDENGNEWKRTINTGDYCESTRVIKRGSYFITETHPENAFPQIGFFRNIWLSLLGFRMIVIIPLLAILIIVLFLILKKKKHSNKSTL